LRRALAPVSLRTHSFVASQCPLHGFPAAAAFHLGQFRLWQSSVLENGRSTGHIQAMEKFIALTVVIAIVVFAASYGLSVWSEHR
jgi:hypothetical protein